jgi:radical SAM protein with 4Fe4S-binding SPASM domain
VKLCSAEPKRARQLPAIDIGVIMELRIPQNREPLEVILKLAGETCNINCYYCYEKRKPYDKARMLSNEDLGAFLLKMAGRPLRLHLHGGEPLLIGMKRMREILQLLRGYPARIDLGIQTNGMLLNDAWLDLFQECWPNIDIGVSLDGPPELNQYRVDYKNRDTTEAVEAALQRAHSRGIPLGVITVVTRLALGHEEDILKYFTGFPAVRSLNLAPCLDFNVRTKKFPTANRSALKSLNPAGVGRPGWATEPHEYAQFLIRMYDLWRTGGYFKRLVIEPFLSVIRRLQGAEPFLCHFAERKCAYILTLYPDGRIGGCDELDMPASWLGDLASSVTVEELVSMQGNSALPARFKPLIDKCSTCSHEAVCGGGCWATRIRYHGTPGDEAYCDYRKRVIDHVAHSISA